MSFEVKVIADSITPYHSARLTTLQCTYPRIIHSELMTHRMFSRNASSSRAIPLSKMIKAVQDNPFLPVHWGRNQSGMSAREELGPEEQAEAKEIWLYMRDQAVAGALSLEEVGLHKQIANRALETWAWITVIITATDWNNFYVQRTHEDAQPEIQHLAKLMRDVYASAVPEELAMGAWHMPYLQREDYVLTGGHLESLRKISVARCARVSYLTQEGTRDHAKDLELYERLRSGGANGHWSPFEHVATPSPTLDYSGNFRGWHQYRKQFTVENQQVN